MTGGEVVTDPTPGLHLAVLGVAESPVRCERDPPDLLRGGPPRGLSSQLPCRVSTLGDGPLTFCDNSLQGSFRLHPLWVMGVSGPAVHRQLSRTGGGALPGVSQTRAPGGVSARARPQNAQPEYGQAMTERWQRRAVDAATRSRELARATAQIYAEGALMYRRLAASYASQQKAERYVAHAERLEQLVRRENHHADWFVRLAHELGRGQQALLRPSPDCRNEASPPNQRRRAENGSRSGLFAHRLAVDPS